ncbi:hypothetical protein ERJ75_001800200 [Trypanosoma vivax]|nr:hypothetical protein ERJ75_001800200 [Trypanosoma vivax]
MRDFLAVQLLLLGIVLARGGDTAAGSTAEAFAPLCTVFLETGVAVKSAKKMTEAARQRVAEVEAQLNATLAAEEERHQEGGLLTAVARRLDIENATQARLQFSLARACSNEGVRPENAQQRPPLCRQPARHSFTRTTWQHWKKRHGKAGTRHWE